MSFFKKIFGATSFADEREQADGLFDAHRYEDARAAYQRAIDRKKGASEEAIAHCEERIAECLDRMAERRMEEAKRLAEEGHFDLAQAELTNAIELAASEEIARRARRTLETLEKDDARRLAEDAEEIDDDDRWAILAGTWEPEQIEEYDEYGEAFRTALLAMHDGRVKEGREALEALLEEHEEDASYLWLEVGRARVLDADYEESEAALRTFLETLDDDEGGEARLSAYAELGGLRDREGDTEGAIAELSEAMDALPDDPRPFLLLGRYMRSKGLAKEAAKVLEAAVPLLPEERPDWRFLEELGLALLEAGREARAVEYLDRVIAFFVSVRRHDAELELPPATAVARAALHEKAGELDRAADLFRGLSRGSDRANHLRYHTECARLLIELELFEEARRMLTRALALAEADPKATAAIETTLSQIESGETLRTEAPATERSTRDE